MLTGAGIDWPAYARGLDQADRRDLARWLAAQDLGHGEFMEIVDRAYARTSGRKLARPRRFVVWVGRPAAEVYARRKRMFARRMAALEEALISGALPGEVAAQELEPAATWRTHRRARGGLLAALRRARRGQA